ncbi:AraC-like DNA-binding protein [Catenuloplanes atrovinosus]|uniref:AraC-like DNA-binding protein n=2 Tax=Catenuloplanes atrovinosus TaxID=137266 RepID=A0AAE4CEY4_9ACTN|nr:AraC-like DNA-binding protein [Catenuloplanes atrovinosus]
MYGRFVARGPWAFSVPTGSSIWIMRVAEGRVMVTTRSDGRTVGAVSGDYLVIPDGDEVVVADRPVVAGDACPARRTPVVRGLARHGQAGPRTDLQAMAFGAAGSPVRSGPLPAVLRLETDTETAAALDATFGLLEHERARGETDADLVTARLAEVLMTHTLRALTATLKTGTGTSPRLFGDPRLARAARAMRDDLAYPWTVAALAREAHMSRAAFAAAFRQAAGESPLALLRRWRLCEAKRLLRETPLSLNEIALRVGYESAPALSRAFTRQERIAPGRWRQIRSGA